METTEMVDPQPKKTDLKTKAVALAVSLAVVFVTVYIAGKAWKKSQ